MPTIIKGAMYMSYDHRITGRIIRTLRVERGMSQEVLSGLADLCRSHLADIENGRVSPSVETLWKLCEALDLPLSELFRRVEAQSVAER